MDSETENEELDMQYEALDWITRFSPDQVAAILKPTKNQKSMTQTVAISIIGGIVMSVTVSMLRTSRNELKMDQLSDPSPIPSASADDFFESPSIVSSYPSESFFSWIVQLILQTLQLIFKY
jgi:hypothetical protein